MIALAEKGLDYDLKQAMCRANRPKDAALSEVYHSIHVDPNSKVMVPVIQHKTDQGMVNIIESVPCAEYVEDAFPDVGNSLRPKSAKQRNQVRMFLEVAGKFMPFPVCMSNHENLDKAFKDFAALAKQLNAALEQWGEPGGDFLLGKEFSMAEVLCGPLLARFSWWDWYRGVNAVEVIEKLGYARLSKWMKAVVARESVKKTFKDMSKPDKEEYFQFLGASPPGKVSYVIKDGTMTVTHIDGKPYKSKPEAPAGHDVTPGMVCAVAAAFFAIAGLSYLRK